MAVWERLNSVTGKSEINFKELANFSAPIIALALHTHVRDYGVKNFKFNGLRKAVADRLLGIGAYKSGEASIRMLDRDPPKFQTAPALELRVARPDDAGDIERIVNVSFEKAPHARTCKAWIMEDLFKPDRVNLLASVGEDKVGFGSASLEKKHGELHYVCVLPKFQRKGYAKAVMNELLKELSVKHPVLALSVESKNVAAIKLFESYGFRGDRDLYFDVYDR